ncbi:MAG: hypothetical protein ACYS9X_02075 [Planctomycetota bacterium]
MSDTDRGPFRRFPWVQLLFCLACLAMAAWTWMRYTYCWDVTVEQLLARTEQTCYHRWPAHSYISIRGMPTFADHPDGNSYLNGINGLAEPAAHVGINGTNIVDPGSCPEVMTFIGRVTGGFAYPLLPDDAAYTVAPTLTHHPDGPYRGYPAVDPHARRPAAETIAGLVVGAMGCFVFGLYLRRWLGERKAVAR